MCNDSRSGKSFEGSSHRVDRLKDVPERRLSVTGIRDDTLIASCRHQRLRLLLAVLKTVLIAGGVPEAAPAMPRLRSQCMNGNLPLMAVLLMSGRLTGLCNSLCRQTVGRLVRNFI